MESCSEDNSNKTCNNPQYYDTNNSQNRNEEDPYLEFQNRRPEITVLKNLPVSPATFWEDFVHNKYLFSCFFFGFIRFLFLILTKLCFIYTHQFYFLFFYDSTTKYE